MERRGFLKGLIGIGLSLSPVGSMIKKLSIAPVVSGEVAATVAAAGKISQPFIISIANPTAEEIMNIDVLGAMKYLGNPEFAKSGSLKINSAEISLKSGQDYQKFLYEIMANPFTIDKMIVKSDNAKQLSLSYPILKQFDCNGTVASMMLIPQWSPYQTEGNYAEVHNRFSIDGMTSLEIGKMYPKTDYDIYLYPSNEKSLLYDNEHKCQTSN